VKLVTTKDKSVTRIRAHVYGDSGVGKTTSLGTLPQNCTVIAAAERSLLPLRQCSYPVVNLESWSDVEELARKMQDPRALVEELKTAHLVSDAFTEIKVLAIDSLTELSELCKAQIVDTDRGQLMADRATLSGKKDKPLGIYDDLMAMEDWGLYQVRIKQMLSALCHLNCHIIMTGLAQWTENKRTGEVMKTPALSGKLALQCPAYFDLVLHMEASESGRFWRTANNGQVIAKDSSGVLDAMELADWSAVFKKIMNGKETK
jgi:hypothetical protein